MPRRVDANQREIVSALRDCGFSVLHLHTVGHGCPDILCGAQGYRNLLFEIKGDKGKLTPDERGFFDTWRGQVALVRSVDEALRVMGKE